MSEILRKIATNSLIKVPTGESTTLQSLWQENDVIFYFLRRFGCPVCRWISKQLSSIKPILDENNVKLVGVGPEKNGLDDFYNHKIFDGDIYIDENKQTYKDLEYTSIGLLTAVGSAFDKSVKDIAKKAKDENLGGNFKGDFNQLGGLLVVKKGGNEILLNYKQKKPSDYLENQEILNSLGIKVNLEANSGNAPTCGTDACGL